LPDSGITKNALSTALKELMLLHPLAKISVGDICARCGMNRKSFYYHFKDKYDLVNWIFHTEFSICFRSSFPKMRMIGPQFYASASIFPITKSFTAMR